MTKVILDHAESDFQEEELRSEKNAELPEKRASAFVVDKPLLRYTSEILFWLALSIGTGLLLGGVITVQLPALPANIDIPEPEKVVKKIPQNNVDYKACDQAVHDILQKQRIHFAVGSTQVSKKGLNVVYAIIEKIKPCEGANLEIEGHTDNTGSLANNISLSKKRADSVAEIINNVVEDNGLAKFSIKTVGVGEALPLASNNTPEGRYKNRRIEMRLYE